MGGADSGINYGNITMSNINVTSTISTCFGFCFTQRFYFTVNRTTNQNFRIELAKALIGN